MFGHLIIGEEEWIKESQEKLAEQPTDWDMTIAKEEAAWQWPKQQTISHPVTVTGPGTFLGKVNRTITVRPYDGDGWWFDRSDLTESLPTRASVRNVWTTTDFVSNIVLRSGSPHNYVRMVEHIIALKLGLGLDNLMISLESGDPPLFDRGALDLIEAIERGKLCETDKPVRFFTVKEKVTAVAPNGAFVTIAPCTSSVPRLNIDCAVDFPSAIGKQRIKFPVNYQNFRYGAEARTNTSAGRKLYCQTVGRLFANIRHLGYNDQNVLVAGKRHYANEPHLIHEGRSLEAVWHRAALDLLAALALVEEGRFVGDVISYKAGHTLDVRLITMLYLHNLLEEIKPHGQKEH